MEKLKILSWCLALLLLIGCQSAQKTSSGEDEVKSSMKIEGVFILQPSIINLLKPHPHPEQRP